MIYTLLKDMYFIINLGSSSCQLGLYQVDRAEESKPQILLGVIIHFAHLFNVFQPRLRELHRL